MASMLRGYIPPSVTAGGQEGKDCPATQGVSFPSLEGTDEIGVSPKWMEEQDCFYYIFNIISRGHIPLHH